MKRLLNKFFSIPIVKELHLYSSMIKSGDPTEMIFALSTGDIIMSGDGRYFRSRGGLIKVDSDIMGSETTLYSLSKGDLETQYHNHGLTYHNALLLSAAISASCLNKDVMKAVDSQRVRNEILYR